MKPAIGINCDLSAEVAGSNPPEAVRHIKEKPSRVFLNSNYCEAIEQAGGIPVLLPPLEEAEDIERLLKRLDGLILSGGDDIWPERYGQTRHATTKDVAEEKDIFDSILVKLALDMDIPVLGICYGTQLINVALGGSLIQDVPSQRPSGVPHKSKTLHKISVERGTRLYEFLGADVLMVNSSHHQAIDRLGEGLRVSARAE
ncbi:MAG TPA: gamma-glutamyl-gamma-aminobutyrate hydrolase family protein, partial [Candidatus Hypogeohydataceae bacterium YC40]